jgi:hypothetical protein
VTFTGKILASVGKLDDAVASFQKCLSLGSDESPHFELAKLYARKKDFEAVQNCMGNILKVLYLT